MALANSRGSRQNFITVRSVRKFPSFILTSIHMIGKIRKACPNVQGKEKNGGCDVFVELCPCGRVYRQVTVVQSLFGLSYVVRLFCRLPSWSFKVISNLFTPSRTAYFSVIADSFTISFSLV